MLKPPQLTPFRAKEQRLYTEQPPVVQAPYPISKTELTTLMEETHFGPCIRDLILLLTAQS